jgi:hypothetical protein
VLCWPCGGQNNDLKRHSPGSLHHVGSRVYFYVSERLVLYRNIDQSQCNSVILRTETAIFSEKSEETDNAAISNSQREHY